MGARSHRTNDRKLAKRQTSRPKHADKYAARAPSPDAVLAAKLAELVARFNGEEGDRG
jgi:hypothetical protein